MGYGWDGLIRSLIGRRMTGGRRDGAHNRRGRCHQLDHIDDQQQPQRHAPTGHAQFPSRPPQRESMPSAKFLAKFLFWVPRFPALPPKRNLIPVQSNVLRRYPPRRIQVGRVRGLGRLSRVGPLRFTFNFSAVAMATQRSPPYPPRWWWWWWWWWWW